MEPVNNHMTTCCPGGTARHHKGGSSSFWMHDPDVIFHELDLKEGDVFLDLGCGTGDYSICAAEETGETGVVYAVDIQEQLIRRLLENAGGLGLTNIRGIANDINDPLPLDDKSVDVCLISTVLHTMDLQSRGDFLFNEVKRVLKPGGRLFIIECKKEQMRFGPPLRMRLSPEEIEACTSRYGFQKTSYIDLGYNYMITLTSGEVQG